MEVAVQIREEFTSRDVSRLTGIPMRTLQDWVAGGFLSPSIRTGIKGPGRGHLWTLGDVLAVGVIARIREALGTNLQVLRRIQEAIRVWTGEDFAGVMLVVAGGDVLLVGDDRETLMSLLRQPGQLAAPQVVFMEDVETEIREKAATMVA